MGQAAKWEDIVHKAMVPFEEINRQQQLVEWERESRFALQAVEKNSKLRECEPQTVMDSIVNVAAVGLTLNPADGYAYLVPEYNKDARRNECQLRISYKGFLKVATDGGPLKLAKAVIVYEGDHFKFKGPFKEPEHESNPFNTERKPIGVYCLAYTNAGEPICDAMAWDEVQKIRKCAKFDGVWAQWEEEMAKKAVLKRAAKYWPRGENDARVNRTIEVMNESEGSPNEWEIIEQAAEQIIQHIDNDDPEAVEQVWDELSDKEKEMIWLAKTKGGYFTQDQKNYIRRTGFMIVNEDVIQEMREKMEQCGVDDEFVVGLLKNTYEDYRSGEKEWNLDSLAVGYARWVVNQLDEYEKAEPEQLTHETG